tara:strand:+ start:85 stop:705 length:621 start_codon:yes stop_codon:yes gene_type:complete
MKKIIYIYILLLTVTTAKADEDVDAILGALDAVIRIAELLSDANEEEQLVNLFDYIDSTAVYEGEVLLYDYSVIKSNAIVVKDGMVIINNYLSNTIDTIPHTDITSFSINSGNSLSEGIVWGALIGTTIVSAVIFSHDEIYDESYSYGAIGILASGAIGALIGSGIPKTETFTINNYEPIKLSINSSYINKDLGIKKLAIGVSINF